MKRVLFLILGFISFSFASNGAKYLIITHDNFYNAILPLAQWKHKKGVPTKVVTLSQIGATPSAIATIKNYIVNAYNTWNPRPEYVLLVGNGAYINSDQNKYDDYFANVTGDYRMDISLGRFPCDSASQCSLLVTKTLGYERTPYLADSLWFRKGTGLIDEDYSSYPPVNSDTVYWNDVRYVANLWRNAGYVQVDSFSRLLGHSTTNVINAIDNGRAFLLYRGQSVTTWGSPFVLNPNNCNNGYKLPIVVSATCATVTLSSSSCQGDRFMNAGTVQNPKGAVGYLGTTVTTTGSGLARCRGTVAQHFYKAIFEEKMPILGDAFKRAKFMIDSIRPLVDNQWSDARYREWNLLGDPELNLWTSTPRPLTVLHDTSIYTGPQNYTVTVKVGSTPVRDALVCVMMNDSIVYQYGYTNNSGVINFSINPPTPGIMSVTVTGHNLIPYEKNVTVQMGGNVHDVGIVAILAPTGTIASGNSVYPKVLIKNYGTYTDTFPVTFKIGSVYSQTINQVILGPGDTVTKQFPVWNATLGTYSMQAYTALNNDQWRINDTAFGSINVVIPHDVGVIAILTPKDTMVQGLTIEPKVIIKNFGGNPETFSVTFKIGNSYSQTLSSVSLAVNMTDTIEFPEWLSTAGSYTTQCYTQLNEDNNRANDTLNGYVFVGSEMLVEGFNRETFPPSGWSSVIISGSYNWQRVTSGTNPTCSPYEGAGMAFYKSWDAPAGSKARLISSPIGLETIPTIVQLKFWMYHDNGYQNYPDSVIVEFSPDGINFYRVEGFGRYSPTNAWTEHSVIIGPDTGTMYIGFLAQSQYGSNMYIDYIRVLSLPLWDVGVYSIQSPLDRLQSGVSQNVRATLKNYGRNQATFLSRAIIIDSMQGINVFTKESIITLPINATQIVNYGQFTPSANKIYYVIVNTDLADDANRSNDTMKARARTTPASNPDSAGYFYESTHNSIYGDTVSYNWFDASSQIELTGWTPSADDGNVKVALPFVFPYYGQSLCSVYVNTNGFLQYPTTFTSQSVANQPLPYGSINNFIGVLWDDLDLRNVYTPRGKVYQYNDPNNEFVVFQWDTVPRYNQTAQRNTFQIILYKDGRIKYQYKRVSTNAQTSSTIGIQAGNGSGNRYLQYNYNGSPSSHIPTTGTAILFNYKKDVGPISIEAPVNSVDSGTTINPIAVVRNYGPNSANINVKFEINDGYSDIQSVTIPGQSFRIISFTPWTARYFGTFTTKCSTLYTDDYNSGNNKITGSVKVRFHDVGAYQIVSPKDTQFVGNLSVIAKFKNYYTRTASCSTKFIIRNESGNIIFAQSGYISNLLADSVRTVDFGNFSALPGKYYTQTYTKLATDDNALNDTIKDSVYVILSAPILTSPNPLETLHTSTPTFDWQDVPMATVYQIQIADTNDFSSRLIDTIVANSQYQYLSPMNNGKYYWRVRAGIPYSVWSETRAFIISTSVTLILPQPNAILNTRTPFFDWQDVNNATQYEIQIDTNQRFSSPMDTTVQISQFQMPAPGLNEGTYFWRVRAGLPYGRWSESRKFTITSSQPGWYRLSGILSNVLNKGVKDGGAMVGVGNYIYAFRGNKSNEFYLFNGTNWVSKESIPFGKKPTDPTKYNIKRVSKGSALCFDGVNKIYATKGNSTREFWVYDLENDTWTSKGFIPPEKGAKAGTSIVFYNGKVYMLVGGRRYGEMNFYVYDTTLNRWYSLNPAPMPDNKPYNAGSCLVIFRDTIFALKGSGNDNYFFAYNVQSNTWSARKNLPLIHPQVTKIKKVKDGGAMTTDHNIIYAIKGGGAQDFWQYLPSLNNWTPLNPVPKLNNDNKSVPKTGAALAYANGRVYLLKGNNTTEFWQYTPAPTLLSPTEPKTAISLMTEKNINILGTKFTVTPNFICHEAKIDFVVSVATQIQIKLYNSTGQIVETILDDYYQGGAYSIRFSTVHLNQGIYFLKYHELGNGKRLVLKIIKK